MRVGAGSKEGEQRARGDGFHRHHSLVIAWGGRRIQWKRRLRTSSGLALAALAIILGCLSAHSSSRSPSWACPADKPGHLRQNLAPQLSLPAPQSHPLYCHGPYGYTPRRQMPLPRCPIERLSVCHRVYCRRGVQPLSAVVSDPGINSKGGASSIPAFRIDPRNSKTAKDTAVALLHELLHESGKSADCMGTPKEMSQGFCNYVWSLEGRDPHPDQVVAKVYSPLHPIRTDRRTWGAVDRVASDLDLGPKVVHESEIGIIHDFFPGRLMEDTDLQEGKPSLELVASKLARLHNASIPDVFQNPREPLIWIFLYSMLEEIERIEDTSEAGNDVPKFFRPEVLRNEIEFCERSLKPLQFPVVLAHGDCKPANAMVYEGKEASKDEISVSLIDFELSGPNYRGYDVMKLFRKQLPEDQRKNMRRFLEAYSLEIGIPSDDRGAYVEALESECHMLEPLTWLEAVVFFSLILHIKPEKSNEWTSLASSRWKAYLDSKGCLAGTKS